MAIEIAQSLPQVRLTVLGDKSKLSQILVIGRHEKLQEVQNYLRLFHKDIVDSTTQIKATQFTVYLGPGVSIEEATNLIRSYVFIAYTSDMVGFSDQKDALTKWDAIEALFPGLSDANTDSVYMFARMAYRDILYHTAADKAKWVYSLYKKAFDEMEEEPREATQIYEQACRDLFTLHTSYAANSNAVPVIGEARSYVEQMNKLLVVARYYSGEMAFNKQLAKSASSECDSEVQQTSKHLGNRTVADLTQLLDLIKAKAGVIKNADEQAKKDKESLQQTTSKIKGLHMQLLSLSPYTPPPPQR